MYNFFFDQNNNARLSRILIAILLPIMITIGVWFTYSALSFDLVSTDPIPTAVDMNVVYIGFIFSKKLSQLVHIVSMMSNSADYP